MANDLGDALKISVREQHRLNNRPLFIAQIAGISCLFVQHLRLLLSGLIGCLASSNSTFQECLSFANPLLELGEYADRQFDTRLSDAA